MLSLVMFGICVLIAKQISSDILKITLVPIVGGTSYFMLLFISKDSFVLEILNQMKMKL